MPMVVLAFLTDPDAVGRILRHLGLSLTAPVLTPARPSGSALGFSLPDQDSMFSDGGDDDGTDFLVSESPIRPPP